MSSSHNRMDEFMLECSIYLRKLELFQMIDFGREGNQFASVSSASQDNDTFPKFEYHGYQCPQIDELLGDSLDRNLKIYCNKSTQIGDTTATNMSMFEEQFEIFGHPEKQNLVSNIFQKFRSIHKFIVDEYPILQKNYLPFDLINNPSTMSSLPRTLNIQYHIQFAHRKVLKFNTRLRRILNANTNSDNQKYKECNDFLESLEILTNNLDGYKDREFRHRDLKFISHNMKVHAEGLDMILKQIDEKMRETHQMFIVFALESTLVDDNSLKLNQQERATVGHVQQLVAIDKQDMQQEQAAEHTDSKMLAAYEFKDIQIAAVDVVPNPFVLPICVEALPGSIACPTIAKLQFMNSVSLCAGNSVWVYESQTTPNIKNNQRTCKPMHNFGF